MSDILEGKNSTVSSEEVGTVRSLFIPKGISWETMYEYGVKMVMRGYTVWMHEHSYGDDCPGRPSRCGQLTPTPKGVILVEQGQSGDKTK